MKLCLHLDLTHGASADMIAGALVAVGAPLPGAEEVLWRSGVPSPRLEVEEVAHGGWRARRARLSIADVVVWPAPSSWVGSSAASASAPRAHTVAGVSAPPARTGRPRRAEPDTAAAAIMNGWLLGGPRPMHELSAMVAAGMLPPIPRALVARGAQLAVEAHAAVAAGAVLDGWALARLYCSLVMNAALLSALDPAAVTASPVGVSAGAAAADELPDGASPVPSPWLMALLAHVPVLEERFPVPLADVAGAAFLRALAPEFAAQGPSIPVGQGMGVGAGVLPGRFIGVRAMLVAPPGLPSREGDARSAPALAVEAVLPAGLDIDGLARALQPLGCALEGVHEERSLIKTRGQLRVRLAAAPEKLEGVVTALYRHGARDVATWWIGLRSAAAVNVTVRVGTGRTAREVRVCVTRHGGRVVRVEPDAEDVRCAAESLGMHMHAVAAEALAVWDRLELERPHARRTAMPGGRGPADSAPGGAPKAEPRRSAPKPTRGRST